MTEEKVPIEKEANAPFCHLHVHSQYSILDATLSIADIAKATKEDGLPAVALTDHGNLFGAVDFYKSCKAIHIQPILGCEVGYTLGNRKEKKKELFHLTLLAKNNEGYTNLSKLSSFGYTEGFYYVPRIDLELLRKFHSGIICLSGCLKSPFSQAIIKKDPILFEQLVQEFTTLFKEDFYLEIQRHRSTQEELELGNILNESWLFQQYQEMVLQEQKICEAFLDASKKYSLPIVATQNCHYLKKDEWKAHEILLNIQSGETLSTSAGGGYSSTPNPKRSTFPSHEYYMKTAQEMKELFSDIPEAISESGKIAQKCSVSLDFTTKHYPVFTLPEKRGQQTSSESERTHEVPEFLRTLCEAGIQKRYTAERLKKVEALYPDKDPMSVVRERLDYELHIITTKGMADYLLIVWDFINWAKRQGIPMGPGRGSGAGSIILYLIEITDIEPLRFHLFFERFINPERISYPDIDVDICMARRQEVLQYMIDTYGKENVAQIITFGTMKAKMSIKDVGRVLNIPLSKVNQIAKLIPEDLNITLEKALEKDRDLKKLFDEDPETNSIITLAKTLEGSIRNTGLHAAGIIVSGKPLTEHIPVTIAKDSDMYVTQYSMKPVELVGMLKIDFLGLKTLTSIQIATDAIRERLGLHIDWVNLELEDEKTFQILNQGRTLGLFQLESGGMQELAKQLHLDSFEEIIAVLSLYRPGPMDMIPSFIARKHGREAIEYDHPWLEPILKETYGIMVYQEQVMQIASRLANYSLGEGDVLRRAMGKKDMKEMARQREKFLKGAAANNIEAPIASAIFDKMEKFAEYGFNKSHAAAYGYLTYVTAYLKANYPGEWLSALMTSDKDDTAKVSKFMHEASAMNIPCLAPDINESGIHFTYTGSGIRFALSAIKGVGEQVVESVLEERKARGAFSSIKEFCQRIDPKKIGKKSIELLIEAGAFDRFSLHRDELIASLEGLYEQAVQTKKEYERGVLSLFGADITPQWQPSTPKKLRSKEALLLREKALLGLFISGHPLFDYATVLERVGTVSMQEALTFPDNSLFRLAFIIETIDVKLSSKTQKKFAILTISDTHNDTLEVPVWPEMYEAYSPFLHENALLWGVFAKESRGDGRDSQISCKWLGEMRGIDLPQIQASEVAYDKAKKMMTRMQKAPQTKGEADKKRPLHQSKPQEENSAISFSLEHLRASHVLALKQRLSTLPEGSCRVALRFLRNNEEVATLVLKKFFDKQALLKETNPFTFS